jgi:prepilin-type N-terminal cleavage/methylation domain-containing protein/prepilin-type processing-associated H-X9-DG protein
MLSNEHNKGFTLAELLAVSAVIAVLIAVLLPCLNRARAAARSLACRSNIHSTAVAFFAYCESHDEYLPPAYSYVGATSLYSQPEEPVNGIRHWSGLFLTEGYATEDALHCPEIRHGGLSPQNTQVSNLDDGQEPGRDGIIDVQARRCAFTVNEVLCPRNRFRVGFEDAQRPSRIVAALQVRRPSHTILLTEWPGDWRIVSGPDSDLSASYMPVHGFRGLGQMAGPDRYDLNMTISDTVRPCMSSATFRRLNSYDLSNAPCGSRRYPPRLDWVGRNHAGITAGKNLKRSSFAYLDGHVESKTVYETIEEGCFEWGDGIYSLAGQNSIQ